MTFVRKDPVWTKLNFKIDQTGSVSEQTLRIPHLDRCARGWCLVTRGPGF